VVLASSCYCTFHYRCSQSVMILVNMFLQSSLIIMECTVKVKFCLQVMCVV